MPAPAPGLTAPQPPSPSRGANLGAMAVIVLAVLAAYHNSFRIPLLFDDAGTITNNQTIRHLWPLGPVLKPLGGGLPSSGRPMVNLSFALNYAISGFNVWSYHLFNLTIHLLAALTLFGIVRRTLHRPRVAFAVALIWAVHPLLTEAVVYLSQRAESLMGLFYLLTLYFFVRAAGGTRPRVFLGLSIFCCFLGMATKEVMASAPLIVLLYDRTFAAGSFREAWRRRRGYYLGLASTWLILAWLVAATGTRGGTAGFGLGISSWDYAQIQFRAIVHYLCLSFWPHPLVFYYDRPMGPAGAITAVDAVLVTLLAVVTVRLLVLPGSRARATGFLGASFFAILAASSSFVPVATETMAEHRMYLSLAAVAIGVVGGLDVLAGRWFGRRGILGGFAAVLLIAAVLGIATERRNRDYRSDRTLWTATVAAAPNSSFAHNNLGNALQELGDIPAAIAECEEALRLNPRNAKAHSNLADALVKVGRLNEAIAHYNEALRITPDDADIHNNLGIALTRAEQPGAAVAHYQAALRLNPDLAVTHNNLGNVWVAIGKLPEAIAEFHEALRLEPGYSGAEDNLAIALIAAHRLPEAVAADERALQLDPDNFSAHCNLGGALADLGRTPEAAEQLAAAARLHPDDGELHNNLGCLLGAMGRDDEARREFETALRLDPRNAAARANLEHLRNPAKKAELDAPDGPR